MQRPNAHDVRRVAVAAFADERTVRRYFADPGRLKPTSRARIADALARLGFATSTPAPSTTTRDDGGRHA
jgi:DNA-binding LacI/PurR family transcriptional regulator